MERDDKLRTTEMLSRQHKLDKEKKTRVMNTQPEEMEMRKEWKDVKPVYLNNAESTFDSKMSSGINNEKSIFDRQAIFHTRNME